ncbi:MAG: transcriptional regulator [Candidatus Pacebacteria bacterium]|nr:transcriptional regulator [Candidatus Paceibacterota bacterium]
MTIAKEGSIVDLVAARRKFLGVRFKDNKTKLRVRKTEITDPLGKLFFQRRLKLRLTCEDVATIGAKQGSNFTYQTVWRLEQGKPSPKPGVVDDIARALGLQIPKELIPNPNQKKEPKLSAGIPTTKLGKLLIEKRLGLKMNQAKFAEYLGICFAMVSKLERGDYNPGENALAKISKALKQKLPTGPLIEK